MENLIRVLSLCIWCSILILNMAHEVEIAGVEVNFNSMMQINFKLPTSCTTILFCHYIEIAHPCLKLGGFQNVNSEMLWIAVLVLCPENKFSLEL